MLAQVTWHTLRPLLLPVILVLLLILLLPRQQKYFQLFPALSKYHCCRAVYASKFLSGLQFRTILVS